MGIFTTSGTSGRKLKRVVSWRDWRLMIGLLHRNPAPPPGEIFMLLGPVDGLLGPSVGVEAARLRGSIPVLAGMWDTRTKVQAIAELRPGVIAGAASYIVHLSEVAAEMGVDLSACGLRAVTSFGEPGAAIDATHATIERALRRRADRRRLRPDRGLAAGRQLPAVARPAHPRGHRRRGVHRPRQRRAGGRGRAGRDRPHHAGRRHPSAAALPHARRRAADRRASRAPAGAPSRASSASRGAPTT